MCRQHIFFEFFFFNLFCYNNTCRYTGDGARLYTGLASTKYRTVSFPTMFFVLMSGVRYCAAHIVAPGLPSSVLCGGPSANRRGP